MSVAAKLGLRCGRRFARSSERIHLTDKLVLGFGKVKIRLFQPQIPLATLFILSLLRQSGALCRLPSEEFGIRHSQACPFRKSYPVVQVMQPCPFRKSYPDVLMMQSGQDWNGDNDTGPLDCSMQGCIFL